MNLLAIGFVNPLLLGGLALIAAPIIIHWLSRRQFKRIAWGATRFLIEAEKENRRRRRMEQWLLLGLRCLAMALLALLVARPFVRPGLVATLLGAGGERHRILVLDDSASLGFQTLSETDGARLSATGQRLLRWLSDAGAGDLVSIYRTSQPAAPVVERARLSAATLPELRARLAELGPTALPAEPRQVLNQVRTVIEGGDPATAIDLYLLSDFQRNEWAGIGTPQGAAFDPLLELDPQRVRVILIAADDAPRDNLAVVDVRPQRPHALAGVPALFEARVANHSGRVLENVAVQVEVGGAAQPAVTIERIEPGATGMAAFEATFVEAGHVPLVVGVPRGDGLAADDQFRLTAAVKPALRTLLVNGAPATDDARDEVYYLRNALAPPGSFASGMLVETADPAELEGLDLGRFDALVLCNVGTLSDTAAALLKRFVRAGGGLLITGGGEVGDGSELNRVLGTDPPDGLLPAAIEGVRRVAADEPAVRIVPAEDAAATLLFPVELGLTESVRFGAFLRLAAAEGPPATTRAAQAEPGDPGAATILARLSDDDRTPLLVEKRYGRGRVALYGSSVDLDWNDWARAVDGSFVITMLELVQRIARHPAERGAYRTGELLTIELAPESYDATGSFRSPRFPDEPALAASAAVAADVQGPLELRGGRATQLGEYAVELKRRDGAIEMRPLAVNLPESESDLASAAAHELKALLGRIPSEYVLARDSFAEDESAGQRELWSTLLLVMVAVLFGEQALAAALGRPAGGHAARGPGRWGWLGSWRRKAA